MTQRLPVLERPNPGFAQKRLRELTGRPPAHGFDAIADGEDAAELPFQPDYIRRSATAGKAAALPPTDGRSHDELKDQP